MLSCRRIPRHREVPRILVRISSEVDTQVPTRSLVRCAGFYRVGIPSYSPHREHQRHR